MSDPIEVPPDVEAILDEASVDGGPYSALVLSDCIRLVETATDKVIREVKWERAGEWRDEMLRRVINDPPLREQTL